jgi:hypothetical protein
MSEVKIKFAEEFTPRTGSVGQLSWSNKDVKAAFEKLFGVRKHEILTGIIVDDTGITAHFLSK